MPSKKIKSFYKITIPSTRLEVQKPDLPIKMYRFWTNYQKFMRRGRALTPKSKHFSSYNLFNGINNQWDQLSKQYLEK